MASDLKPLVDFQEDGLSIEILKKYTEIGFNEIIFPFPLLEKEVLLFEKFTFEVIPEIRKKY
ncbi:MAG: hypothetical protein EAX90_01895 [Candidatus Heimdallarchaeota archaeon]|nr:hypothetical protein [Candidatus Heimdallarchaeota archaeon]